MVDTPQISVLLPFRNDTVYLKDALNSIKNQTMQNWETVLVDDGSTEQEMAFLEQWIAGDRRFRLFRRPAQGLVAALNFGLAKCKAPLVVRMDADDVNFSNRLEMQKKWMDEHEKVTVAGCLVKPLANYLTEGMKRYLGWVNECVLSDDISRGLWVESPLPHPSVIYRLNEILDLGGYRDFDGPEDYDLWLRLREKGKELGKVPMSLVHWRIRSGSLSRKDARYSTEAFRRLKFEFLVRWIRQNQIDENRLLWIWGAGKGGGRLFSVLKKNGIDVDGFVDIDPHKASSCRMDRNVILPGRIKNLPKNSFFLAYVERWNARKQITDFLENLGKIPEKDFVVL